MNRLVVLGLLVGSTSLGAQTAPTYRGVTAAMSMAQVEQTLGVRFRCAGPAIYNERVCEAGPVRLPPDQREFTVYVVIDSATRQLHTVGFRRTVTEAELTPTFEALALRYGSPGDYRLGTSEWREGRYSLSARTTFGQDSLFIWTTDRYLSHQLAQAWDRRRRAALAATVEP